MTVNVTTTSSGPYVGNGVTVVFPFAFKAMSGDEVRVRRVLYVENVLGDEIPEVATDEVLDPSSYAVTVNQPAGGSVTFSVAPEADEIWIESDPDFTQNISFTDTESYSPEQLDEGNDRAAVRAIYLRDRIDDIDDNFSQRVYQSVEPSGTARIEYDSSSDRVIFYIPPSFNVDTAPDGLIRMPTLTPEMFADQKPSGVLGDGTDDGPALLAFSQALSALGGIGVLDRGATYWIGDQVLNSQPPIWIDANPYTWGPVTWIPILIDNAQRAVTLFGNGAKIKVLPGKKFGAFDEAGDPVASVSPFYGNVGVAGKNRASAYSAMVGIRNCSAPVTIHDLELDGDADSYELGGVWGDTGWQMAGTGVFTENNTSSIRLININSHHHGCDGAMFADKPVAISAQKSLSIVEGCRFEFNRRQGVSHIGGRGFTYRNCSFSYTGKVARGSDTYADFYSAPCAGINFESETGYTDEIIFDNCEFVANTGGGMDNVGSRTGKVVCRVCTFVGTTNYGIFDARNASFEHCNFVGTIVWQGGDTGYNPATVTRQASSQFRRCFFYNANALSPTGTTRVTGGGFVENPGFGCIFDNCTFTHDRAGFFYPGGSAFDQYDGPMFNHCEFIVKQGIMGIIGGRLTGSAFIKEEGAGVINSFPLGAHKGWGLEGKELSSIAHCPWWYVKADGTRTEYPPSIDDSGSYRGTGTVGDGDFTTVNPPTAPAANTAYGLATIRLEVPLTGVRTVTLSTVNAKHGMRRRFVRASTATGGSAWSIGGLKNLAVSQHCEVEYDAVAAAWKLVRFGSL